MGCSESVCVATWFRRSWSDNSAGPTKGCGPHTEGCAGHKGLRGLGPAAADGAVGGRHVVAGGLDLLAVGVGLFVDDLEVAAQLGDELLAGHRTRTTPEVAGGQHIAHDGLVLGLQRGGLGTDQGAVGIHVAELVTNRHERVLLKDLCGWGLAGQDLLGGLLLLLVVVGVADQPVAHTVQHVDDVAEGLIHLAHGVVGRHLGRPAPAGTGDVLARRPHLAGLVLHRLGVHIKTARHRPHLMRVSHKTSRHILCSLIVLIGNSQSPWPKRNESHSFVSSLAAHAQWSAGTRWPACSRAARVRSSRIRRALETPWPSSRPPAPAGIRRMAGAPPRPGASHIWKQLPRLYPRRRPTLRPSASPPS